MKPRILFALLVSLLPCLAIGAKAGKENKKHGQHGSASRMINRFDKDANGKIDAAELPALQQAFSAFRDVDKDHDGTISQAEADNLKIKARGSKGGRRHGDDSVKTADKNGNHRIDADELEGLQKQIAGTRTMSKLDRDGDGKLETAEVSRLNKRLERSGTKKGSS